MFSIMFLQVRLGCWARRLSILEWLATFFSLALVFLFSIAMNDLVGVSLIWGYME